MSVFIAVAALLAAVALAFILFALRSIAPRARASRDAVNTAVHRDQLRELDADLAAGTLSPAHYERARRELEARVLEDVTERDRATPAASARSRTAVVIAALAIPIAAAGVYLVVGTPQALSPRARAPAAGPEGVTQQQIAAMVEKLAARLAQNPEDAEGWAMLGRSYGVLGRFDEAARAYRNAVQREPRDAQLLTDYADALAMAQGRNLSGEPEKLLADALRIDPQNLKALALAGTAAFERRDYARAAELWGQLVKRVPPDSELAKAVQASIDDARARAADADAKR